MTNEISSLVYGRGLCAAGTFGWPGYVRESILHLTERVRLVPRQAFKEFRVRARKSSAFDAAGVGFEWVRIRVIRLSTGKPSVFASATRVIYESASLPGREVENDKNPSLMFSNKIIQHIACAPLHNKHFLIVFIFYMIIYRRDRHNRHHYPH